MIRFAIALLLIPQFSFGEDNKLEWSGKLWGNYLAKLDSIIENNTQTNAGGMLKVKHSLNDHIQVKFEGIAYHIQSPFLYVPHNDLSSGELFSELNEANVSAQFGSFNFKAGQIITSWGKSDGLNPTDFLTGKRNILLVADDQLTRRGHTSFMVEWLPNEGASPWSVQQWIVGLHSKNDVLLNQELIGDFITISSPDTSKIPEVATRLSYAGQGWDFDYTYFSGVNKTPIFIENSFNLFPLNLKLTPKYVRQSSHGVNLAKDFEDFIIRFEGAFTQRSEVESVDYISNPDRFDLVAGIETSFFETHRVNMQGVVHHYPDYKLNQPTNQLEEQIQILNRFILAQHLQTRLGYLFIYYFEPTTLNQFKFKFSWLNYFHQEDANLFTPQVEYQFNNNLNFQMYGLIFKGSSNAPFGALEDLSSVGIGANYVF